MATNEHELWLRINGIQPAFGFEYSLDAPRANEGRGDPYRQANTSYSLLQIKQGKVVRHTLIDIGMGVVPSLLELERDHHVSTVEEVFLSHSHFDHVAGLDWLCGALKRSKRSEQRRPLDVFCSQKCWQHGPQRLFPYLIGRSIEHQPIKSNVAIELGDMSITPFRVQHDESAPGARGFVIQYANRKVLLPCDFLTIDNEADPLLRDADVCFMHTTNWHEASFTGHHCAADALRLIDLWQPKRTYLSHYSGFHDAKHPDDEIANCAMDSRQLTAAVDQVRGSRDLRIAQHGVIIGLDEPWPQ